MGNIHKNKGELIPRLRSIRLVRIFGFIFIFIGILLLIVSEGLIPPLVSGLILISVGGLFVNNGQNAKLIL